MRILLITIIIGLFVALLFVNVYFRVKVLKAYKKLVQQKVEFGAVHIFNKAKMEAEILPRYPNSRQDILDFSKYLRNTITMASVLIGLITLFGGVLMYYRE